MAAKDMSIDEFMALAASKAPTPGGGSVAALIGAAGAALSAMVCSLTAGKEAYKDSQALAVEGEKAAKAFKDRFLDAVDRDMESFGTVSAAYKLPKNTDEEKRERGNAIQEALKGCTLPPFEMMELSAEAIVLTKSLIGRTNKGAASDIAVAASCLSAAMESAWMNVLINLGSIKDEEFVKEYREKGESLLAEYVPMARECVETVARTL